MDSHCLGILQDSRTGLGDTELGFETPLRIELLRLDKNTIQIPPVHGHYKFWWLNIAMQVRTESGLEDLHEGPRGVSNNPLRRLTDLFSPVRMRIPSADASIRWFRGLFGFVSPSLHSPFTNEEVGGSQELSGNGSDQNDVKVHPDPTPLPEELVAEQVTERESLEGILPLTLVPPSVIELLAPINNHVSVKDIDVRADGDGHLLSHSVETVMSEEIDTSPKSDPGLETKKLKKRKGRT